MQLAESERPRSGNGLHYNHSASLSKLEAWALPASKCCGSDMKPAVETITARLIERCAQCGRSQYVPVRRPPVDPTDKPLPARYERNLPPSMRTRALADLPPEEELEL